MMLFNNLVTASKQHFPYLKIKYKNKSILMKLLSFLFFFNKKFMTECLTTIGYTIYLPSEHYMKIKPVSGSVIFMHELVHLYDKRKLGILFTLGYMLPQILIIPSLLLFLISWKIAIPVIIILLTPLVPAYFRMIFEKRAYLSSIYVIQKLSIKLNFNPHLPSQIEHFLSQFNNSYYYWMWHFNLEDEFEKAMREVENNKKPYNDEIFVLLDDLMAKM
jgi:hypothetical protein